MSVATAHRPPTAEAEPTTPHGHGPARGSARHSSAGLSGPDGAGAGESGRRRPAPRAGLLSAIACRAILFACGAILSACAPIVRPPGFVGARDAVTDTTLLGPFDGQVLDATTSEPIADATVVAVWSYDRGDGFIGPYGAETTSVTTDAAGRYRIPAAKLSVRGSTVRLVDAYLVVYKRGYAGYRSDALQGGSPRADFTVRHNKVELRKWQNSDSHADHLLFLAPPRALQKAVRWEAELANLDLFRAHGGAGGPAAPVEETTEKPEVVVPEVLDAYALLTPDEIRQRTGYAEAFEVKDLTDLKRTDFYHGVHIQALAGDERYDLALRVWRAPPGGMNPVAATIQESVGKVKPTGDITPETWMVTADGVHAVAFVDREQKVGVLLTCGDHQCADLDTAIILAKTVLRHLDRLKLVPSPEATAAPAPGGSTPGAQPTAPAPGGVPTGAVPGKGPAPGAAEGGPRTPAGVASPKGQGAPTMSPGTGSTPAPSGGEPPPASPGPGPQKGRRP